MRLSRLAGEIALAKVEGPGDPEITAVTPDSRKVFPGALFAVVTGDRDDGANYVADAVARGAVAVLTGAPLAGSGVPAVVVPDVRKALGEAAAALCGHPSGRLSLIGVTGTNGKTTTAYIVRHVLNRLGMRCGMLGTIEYDFGLRTMDSPLTTPDAAEFSAALAEMLDCGCEAAAVEVSSHALAQRRVWPHRFACGVFTNLTRDHLDYHGDMERYALAKKLLFDRLDGGATAVLNFDDPHAGMMAADTAASVAGYALGDAAAPFGGRVRARILRSGLLGQTVAVDGGDGEALEIHVPLVGTHNVRNCLGAMLAAESLGISRRDAAGAVASFPGVPGRLERVECPSGALAFVDYAHTDDALRSVLGVLRPMTEGKLIVVFGCGGDRDRGKRPLMAKAAEEFADKVYVTDDNPRTEDPGRIFSDIRAGFSRPRDVSFVSGRPEAVAEAVVSARPGDVVLVAGKGHERHQVVQAARLRMDDRELIRAARGRG